MDISANEFQKLEENKEEGELVNRSEEEIVSIEAEIGNRLREREVGNPKRAERPVRRSREKLCPEKLKWV